MAARSASAPAGCVAERGRARSAVARQSASKSRPARWSIWACNGADPRHSGREVQAVQRSLDDPPCCFLRRVTSPGAATLRSYAQIAIRGLGAAVVRARLSRLRFLPRTPEGGRSSRFVADFQQTLIASPMSSGVAERQAAPAPVAARAPDRGRAPWRISRTSRRRWPPLRPSQRHCTLPRSLICSM